MVLQQMIAGAIVLRDGHFHDRVIAETKKRFDKLKSESSEYRLLFRAVLKMCDDMTDTI